MKSLTAFVESFLSSFQLLTLNARRVFKYLQFLSKKYRQVFPSLQKIADDCRLSKRQVQRILGQFKERQWLASFKRAYQSNAYYVSPELTDLNLDNPKTFEKPSFCRDNVHPDVHILGSYKEIKEINSTEASPVSSQKAIKKLANPVLNQFRSLSPDQKVSLTYDFSEFSLTKAIENVNWWLSQGNKPNCLYAVLRSMAKKASNMFRGEVC